MPVRMSIQQEVLDCIGPDGINARDLRARLGNIPQGELDVCTNALMRSQKLSLTFGRFELVGARPVQAEAPPNAQEEAAVSLLQPVSRVCVTCGGKPQAPHEFRFVGPGDARAKECNTCHGKKAQAGQAKQRGKRAEPILFHSAQKTTTHCDIAQSVERLTVTEDVPGSSPGVAATHTQESPPPKSAGASTLAIEAHAGPAALSVLERVKTRRQNALNRVVVLAVEMENLRSEVRDCERFVELWERFAGVQQ